MNSIMVAGGAGFIGGTFVRLVLATTDLRVVTVDKLAGVGNLSALADCVARANHAFVRGDIRDRQLMLHVLRQYDCDAVVNLATESRVDRSIGFPLQFVQTNVVGAATLLDAALEHWDRLRGHRRDAFRFLQVSSEQVFGSLSGRALATESSPFAPNSPYAASVAAADHFARAYSRTYGLPTAISHAAGNYGPGQSREEFIPLAILNAVAGLPIAIYGDGSHVRDWLHVRDHCHGLLAILSLARGGDVFNLGGECERTGLQVVHAICETVDRLRPGQRSTKDLICFVPDWPGHDARQAVDSSRACADIGWRPSISFADGLAETVAWYVRHHGSFAPHSQRRGVRRASSAGSMPAAGLLDIYPSSN